MKKNNKESKNKCWKQKKMEPKNSYSPLKQGVIQFESTRFM